MSLYFRLGGAALVMIAALLISRYYEKYLLKRVDEYSGLVLLVTHMENEITKYLAYGNRLWSNFRHDGLEKCGFLPVLRECGSISEALSNVGDRMSLSRASREHLAESFSRLGRGYLDEELGLLSEIKDSLSAELDTERIEAEKNIKVVRALLLGGALAVVVMVI